MQTAVPTREKGDFVAVHPVRVVRPPRTIIYKNLGPVFPRPPGPPPTPPPLEGVPLLYHRLRLPGCNRALLVIEGFFWRSIQPVS